MKTKIALTIMALGLALPAINLNAQDDSPRPPRGPHGGEPRPGVPPPLIAALDGNHDGVIDQTELAAAPESLKALDKNGDGQLTREELRPDRGPRPGNTEDQPDRPERPHPPQKKLAPPEGLDRPGPGRPPGSPIVAVLDANHDGVIDASEIAAASAALQKLDIDGDGKLTGDEIRPHRPEGGPEGPGAGERPPRGPGGARSKPVKQ